MFQIIKFKEKFRNSKSLIHEKISFKRNEKNVAYEVTSTQLPAMIGGAFVDLFMTKGHMREPHWHPNAWELML